MLAQRWANVGVQPLGQRWANWQIHVGPTLVSRRWPNVRVDVGPTLGQRRNASWDVLLSKWDIHKQLLEGFQQQRVNTLTNMTAIRMGCAGVPVKYFLFCDVWHIFASPFSHNRSVNTWIYCLYVFRKMYIKNMVQFIIWITPFESIDQ